jgi:hypothetical protein
VSERPSTRSGVVGYVIVLVGVAGGCTSAPQMATSMASPKGPRNPSIDGALARRDEDSFRAKGRPFTPSRRPLGSSRRAERRAVSLVGPRFEYEDDNVP